MLIYAAEVDPGRLRKRALLQALAEQADSDGLIALPKYPALHVSRVKIQGTIGDFFPNNQIGKV